MDLITQKSCILYWSRAKETPWIEAPASQRTAIAASGRAEFITALDLTKVGDDPGAWRYSGDFYLDFDAADIGETITKVQEFLDHLAVKYGRDLDQVRIFASGKKGFHVEIPAACFRIGDAPLERLPAIYREMAAALYFDTMDLAVYTAKSGRMWRVPNVKRPDTGTYKVQITPGEVAIMTPDLYRHLCAEPRPLFPVQPATLCSALAALFVVAREKVAAASKRKPLQDKQAAALKRRCEKSGYVLPPSLLVVATGRSPARDGLGFNQIALQLAIAARDCGLNADGLIEICQGLIKCHHGDGSRYGTVAKRKAELRRQFAYVTENPAYIFNVGAVRSVLPASARCADLRGL